MIGRAYRLDPKDGDAFWMLYHDTSDEEIYPGDVLLCIGERERWGEDFCDVIHCGRLCYIERWCLEHEDFVRMHDVQTGIGS